MTEGKSLKRNNCKENKEKEKNKKIKMDSKFEVFYFPIQARAEYIRLVLAAGKANWENKAVGDWGKEKFNTEGLLFKQVPMLIEHKSSGDEFRLVQTGTIIRYLANKLSKYQDKLKKII